MKWFRSCLPDHLGKVFFPLDLDHICPNHAWGFRPWRVGEPYWHSEAHKFLAGVSDKVSWLGICSPVQIRIVARQPSSGWAETVTSSLQGDHENFFFLPYTPDPFSFTVFPMLQWKTLMSFLFLPIINSNNNNKKSQECKIGSILL